LSDDVSIEKGIVRANPSLQTRPWTYFPPDVKKFKDADVEFPDGFNCVAISKARGIPFQVLQERVIHGAQLLLFMKCSDCLDHFDKIQRLLTAPEEPLRAHAPRMTSRFVRSKTPNFLDEPIVIHRPSTGSFRTSLRGDGPVIWSVDETQVQSVEPFRVRTPKAKLPSVTAMSKLLHLKAVTGICARRMVANPFVFMP
jgi:hypothetical protein